MFERHDIEQGVEFVMSSEFANVDRLLDETKNYLENYDIKDTSPLKITLRELTLNAIEHGNFKIPESRVFCGIKSLRSNRFEIKVRDEGEGFDHNTIPLEASEDPRNERKRGFTLVRRLSDEIRFNEKGNEVTAYVGIVERTEYDTQDEGNDSVKVTPSGDITAAAADDFKNILSQAFEKGTRCFIFDFSKVEEIDSIGLSVLVALSNSLKERENGEINIVNVSPEVSNLFSILKLDEVLNIQTNNTQKDGGNACTS